MPIKLQPAATGLFFLFTSLFNLLQSQNFCYTAEMQEKWFSSHPDQHRKFVEERQKLLQQVALNSQKPAPSASSAYTIPVVFHILHQGGNENISDAQVMDAVNILTRDFNKLNADTASVVAAFKPLIGNPQIHFQLATKDPNGNCTNGIIRHWDANTGAWDGDFSKYLYSWPSNRYLNIYVVKLITFPAAGYTYLPGSGIPSSVDAIVVLSSYVGSIGTSQQGLSRVLSHEVGHWLNLEHTWGWNSVGSTCGDDGIADTPVTKGWSSCNLGIAAVCTPNVTENVQNYMEYAYCQHMFTIGQSNVIQASMQNSFFTRDNLTTPQNLAATGITSAGIGCLPKLDILAYPGATVCAGRSLALKSFTWNANPSTYQWSATSGVNILSPNGPTTAVTFNTPGTVTITCLASNSSGADAKSVVVTVRNGSTEVNSNYSESFENNSLALPANWTIINPTSPNEKWTISPLDGSGGTKCMYVPGESLPPGSIEILESPSYDFKNNPGATFTYLYAYARASSSHLDVFKVQASKDCGGTWTDIWVPGMAGLANGSGGVTSTLFHPTISQWKLYNLTAHPNFIPFLNEENVRIRFYFQEDPAGTEAGNRFYLDDISFQAPMGIRQVERQSELRIFPNPASDYISLGLNLNAGDIAVYSITDVSGRVLLEGHIDHEAETLANLSGLAPGIYFVNVQTSRFRTAKKIIRE